MKTIFVFFLLLVLGSGAAGALEIAEGVITTQVENHRPVDRVQRWSAAAGPLYCFTQIIGVEEPTVRSNNCGSNGLKSRPGSCPFTPVVQGSGV